MPSAVVLSVAGALLATQLDGDVLRRIFGGMALIVALRFLYQAVLAMRLPSTASEDAEL